LESTKLKEIHIIKKEKWKKPLIGKMEAIPSVVIRERGFSERFDLVGSNVRESV
jgi:hypothetical protein